MKSEILCELHCNKCLLLFFLVVSSLEFPSREILDYMC
jgi:hypothetical protein